MEVYKLLSPEAVVAFKKYNTEAINKFPKKRGIHMTDIAGQEPLPHEDTTPEEQHDPHQFDDAPGSESDPILDYVNSQHHQEEGMNNALQAYNVMTSPTSDVTPHRSINLVHIHLFYHVAQAKQAQHGPLVDRGANGGLAGSDVSVLSKSSRQYIVTGDTTYIKTQVFRLLRYYSPAPRNIARSDWATQNITHNMTSPIT